MLVSLVVAVLAGAAVVAAQSTRDDSGDPFLVATGPVGTTAPVTSPPPATEPVVTLPEEETVTDEPEAPPPPPPRQQRRTLINWPAATDGYTIVIASIPKGARAEATRRAKAASDAGLEDVGLLDSSRYPSLVPGYLVVFSGVFSSRGEAERAIASARASGYNDAYAAQVAR